MVVAEIVKDKPLVPTVVDSKPLTYAPITLIEGEQGGGKSTTAVARIIDAVYKDLIAIQSPSGKRYRVSPLTKEQKTILQSNKLPCDRTVVNCYFDGERPKIIKMPKDFILVPGFQIFCNFHLFGVVYTYATLQDIIKGLDAGRINNAYLVIDEAYIGSNAWEYMTSFGKALNKYAMSIRKRHIHLIMIYPHERLATWVYRWAVTERILCTCDDETFMVTLVIKKRKQQPKTIEYWACTYWPYYDTDELFKLSASQVSKAAAGAREKMAEEGDDDFAS